MTLTTAGPVSGGQVNELPSAHILGLGHVLSFPEPKKTPTLTLTLGVTYGGKRSFQLDSDETPPFLARS